MKKFLLSISILTLFFSFPIYAQETENTTVVIEPKASYVFDTVGAGVDKSGYVGDCSLTGVGSGTLKITLQKYSTTYNSWLTSAGPYSKSFSGTTVCALSKSKILSKGKYRCKTQVTATVGSHKDSRTVYSPTLTIN